MSVKAMSRAWELDLPHNELLVLLAMADHADHDGKSIYPSMGLIAWKTGYSERQVRRVVKSLVKKGILILVKSGNGKVNHYRMDYKAGTVKADYNTPDKMSDGVGHNSVNPTPDIIVSDKSSVKPSIKESVDKPQAQASKEQKDKPRDRLFDMIALVCFGLDYKQESNTEAIKLNAARIGMIKSFLLKQNASPEDVWAFKKWWLAKYPDADIPQDRAKFSKHFIAFRTSPKPLPNYVPSQSIASIPEITESDRLEALALIQASKAKKEEIS